MEPTKVCWGCIGIMEKKMEAAIIMVYPPTYRALVIPWAFLRLPGPSPIRGPTRLPQGPVAGAWRKEAQDERILCRFKITLRIQAPNNHILTHSLYCNYYCPNPTYLIIGYMDPGI